MNLPNFAPVAKPFRLLAFLALSALTATPSMARQVHDPAAFTGHLRPRILEAGTRADWSLEARMAHYGVPGVAIAVIENGAVTYAAGYGVREAGSGERVDADTLFSAGSVSKIATSALVLRLAAQGRVDLDTDILSGMTSWSLPRERDPFGTPVSLRAVLSHTSGFSVHGFADYPPGADLPTPVETLDGQAPALNDPVERLFPAGEAYAYSGGGFTVAQVYLSDRLSAPFATIARDNLFAPLGMTRSTFTNPLPPQSGNIAHAHNGNGEPVALPRGYEAMPEMAASGLWTSAHDLGALVAALIGSYRGERDFLPRSLGVAMMTRVAPGEHGLGPRVTGQGRDFIFHHGGSNESYQAWIEGHPETGEGLVILTNGARGRALIDEIRNAVADTMGWHVNPPVRPISVPVADEQLDAYAGIYTVDAAFPSDLRRQMSGRFFEVPLEFRVIDGQLAGGRAGGDRFDPMIPVAPTRFVLPGLSLTVGVAEVEFHRNALGTVTGMTFRLENAMSHYRPQ